MSTDTPRRSIRRPIITRAVLAALAVLALGAVLSLYSSLLAVAGGVLAAYAVAIDMRHTLHAQEEGDQ